MGNTIADVIHWFIAGTAPEAEVNTVAQPVTSGSVPSAAAPTDADTKAVAAGNDDASADHAAQPANKRRKKSAPAGTASCIQKAARIIALYVLHMAMCSPFSLPACVITRTQRPALPLLYKQLFVDSKG